MTEGRPDDFGAVRWGKHGTLRLQGMGHVPARGQRNFGARGHLRR
jgi:hypothetical protein